MKLNIFRLFLFVMTFGICGALVSTSVAATWYVDGHVASSGNGTSWATALKTIAEVQNKMGNGQEHLVLIRGDNLYYEQNMYANDDGISESQPIVYRGVPGTNGIGRLPIVHGANDYDEAAFATTNGYAGVYWIPDASALYQAWEGPLGGEWGYDWTLYQEMSNVAGVESNQASWYSDGTTLFVQTSDSSAPDNFIIKTTSANNGFQIYANHLVFENLEMRHYRKAAARVMDNLREDIVFRSNIVHHTGGEGLQSWGGTDIYFYDNTVFSCPGAGIHGGNGGKHVVVARNNVYDSNGVTLDAEASEVYGNTLSFNGRAFFLSPGDNHVIYNNLVYGSSGHGLRIINGTNCWIYNNTFYSNVNIEIYLDNVSTDARVFNNIMWATQPGFEGIYVESAATSGFQSDNNLIFTNNGANVGHWAGTDQASLSDWQNASGQDANSISANPRFVNAAASNFHLAVLSPCMEAGRASLGGVNAPGVDIDGDERPQQAQYDIGADERVPTGSTIMIQ